MEKFSKEYQKLFKDKPRNILEIGSRDGDDANYLQECFNIDSSNVYIVEPIPQQTIKIKDKYPNYRTFEFAISQSIGISTFNFYNTNDKNSMGMSSLLVKNKKYLNDHQQNIINNINQK